MTSTAKNLIIILLSGIMGLATVSCGTQRHTATKAPSTEYKKAEDRHKAPKRNVALARIDLKAAENPVTESLLREADSWIGTPYSWGGNDRNGVDCSGFVLQVYQRSLSIDLPRNSEKQMEFCRKIEKDELSPGDLVFFTVRGGDRVGHVGIYIGNGNMVHSSSSKGVIITPLDNPYFEKNYFSSGRVDRYYAMVDKRAPKAKAPAPAAKPVQAAKPRPVTKPETKREITLETLTAGKTPMPSQVFASNNTETKKTADPVTDEEEEPDYDLFD